MQRFTDKTVLVTGAASGIGRAAARRFAQEGARVVAMDRDWEALEPLAKDMPADRTLLQPGDTSARPQAERAVTAAVERFGGIDVLINNAGIHLGGDIEATEESAFERVMAVNVGGYFHMAKAAMPHLKATRGSIVMTSSVSGLGGDWGMFAYNTAKGAVTNMVRAMALDHGRDGVRVNAVCPTFTNTGMTRDMQDEKTIQAFLCRLAIQRIGQPEDIAAAMAFLASEDASFITGVNLPVDGGLSASNGQPQM